MGSFSIWHWLIIVIFAGAISGAIYGVYRFAKRHGGVGDVHQVDVAGEYELGHEDSFGKWGGVVN